MAAAGAAATAAAARATADLEDLAAAGAALGLAPEELPAVARAAVCRRWAAEVGEALSAGARAEARAFI